MTMLLIAGIAVLAAGLLAIAFGIPVKEFSLGNTLILAGAVAACTGVIMLGLAVVVRELQNIARRLGPANPAATARAKSEPQLASAAAGDQPAPTNLDGAEPAGKQSPSASSPAPWQEGAGARDRGRERWCAGSGAAGAGSRHQAAAQSAVFVVVAQGARTRGAHARCTRRRSRSRASGPPAGAERTCSRQLRRCLAAIGPGAVRRIAAPPYAFDVRRAECRRTAPAPERRCATGAERGAGSGDGAQIRRRRWDGLFAVFRWFDRGADAGGHDALRIHR